MRFYGTLLFALVFSPSFAADEPHSPVMMHFLCLADAQYEPIARAMGKGQGRTVYEQGQQCLNEKLPAAVAAAGNNTDLKAAVKAYHVKGMLYLKSPDDRVVQRELNEAVATLEMEGKAAGLWH